MEQGAALGAQGLPPATSCTLSSGRKGEQLLIGSSYPLVKGSPGRFRFPPLLPPPALKDPTCAALVGRLFLSKGQQILGETLLCQFYAWHRGRGWAGGTWVNRTGKAPPSWSLFLGEGSKDKKGDKLKVGD